MSRGAVVVLALDSGETESAVVLDADALSRGLRGVVYGPVV